MSAPPPDISKAFRFNKGRHLIKTFTKYFAPRLRVYLLTNSYMPSPVGNKLELNLKEAVLLGFYFIYLKRKKITVFRIDGELLNANNLSIQ